ncbi:hypothetical protein H9X85_11325 [Anaerotignum lactatifermentans]|uniref:NfeD-like C-terminal domain-containing protein n=1 Tax=Anaerotignum lactatifermentans TaxID=160404 RepID=A0ABS2GDG2_9FIRM|nr:NfeD family protein [Anaerotignum lactatifermentans]MBM6830172.1 hypothetical protein [Anaerotignum lactatifermentans]MBM6878683.1 hypothetical protein [Anaerotignum lactatifermentans]MBM6951785.1 hypothetical protein [Anaerotignum lactatifermentans]
MLPWIILIGILGLVLVFAEILMPGFGIFGILGAVAMIVTAVLSYFSYGISGFLLALVLLVIVFAAMVVFAKKSGMYNKVVLTAKQEAKDFDESALTGLMGMEGVTQTTLRPFGVADFQGKSVDVCSAGDFIDRGKKVRVTRISGKTVTVVECETEK